MHTTEEDSRGMERRLHKQISGMEGRLRQRLTTRIYGAAAFITAVLGILNYMIG